MEDIEDVISILRSKTYYMYSEKTDKKTGKYVTPVNYEYLNSFKPILEEDPSWTEEKNQIVTFATIGRYSLIKSYLNGLGEICEKDTLAIHLGHKSYIPRTFVLNSKTLEEDLSKVPEFPNSDSWFLKRAKGTAGGTDVFPIITPNLKFVVRKLVKKSAYNLRRPVEYVLQESISKPLLLKNRKVDFRFYGIIVYLNGAFNFYTYDIALIRFAINKYTHSRDLTSQLTNTAVAKEKLTKEELYDVTTLLDKNHECYKFMHDFRVIASDVITESEIYFKLKENYAGFVFIGFDFIIDNKGKVYLLEVNNRPAIYNEENPHRYLLHKNLEEEFIPDSFKISVEALSNNKLINDDVGGWKYCGGFV